LSKSLKTHNTVEKGKKKKRKKEAHRSYLNIVVALSPFFFFLFPLGGNGARKRERKNLPGIYI
jgi:hypothetical protein